MAPNRLMDRKKLLFFRCEGEVNNANPKGSHLIIVMQLRYFYIVMHGKDLINDV